MWKLAEGQVTPEVLEHAIKEAERFILVAKKALANTYQGQGGESIYFRLPDLRQTRAASMDLSKAMASVRSGNATPLITPYGKGHR